jgi:putative phosphonate metabolism protein
MIGLRWSVLRLLAGRFAHPRVTRMKVQRQAGDRPASFDAMRGASGHAADFRRKTGVVRAGCRQTDQGDTMTAIRRYAIYHAPPSGVLARRAAGWLGWDPETGQAVPRPELGLSAEEMTAEPRRYGFHATIKPPFRLAPGHTASALSVALDALTGQLAPVVVPGLELRSLGGFLALVPVSESTPLQDLAAAIVRGLDPFRAPLTAAELTRRRPERLTPRQRALLDLWGYPYVMEEFRFHMTLTDSLPPEQADRAAPILRHWFAEVLPRPYAITDLCLFGERSDDGQFVLLSRHPLQGGA